jgi:hypothetical protein
MKPLQIGLLVAAGALGGALVMKWQSARHPSVAAVTATAPAAATTASAPAPEAAATEQPAPEPPAKVEAPSAFPEKNKTKEPRQKAVAKQRAEPAVIAQVQAPPSAPPAAAPAPPVAAAEPSAPPVRTAPPAQPIQEPAREPSPPPAPAEPNRVTLDAGTLIPIRLVDGLSTERSLPGDTFNATLDAPLVVSGFAIAERGARIEGKVISSAKAGKVSGVSKLEIALTGITTSDGQHVRIQTQTFSKNGETSHGEDATKVGAGVGIGAVIGAIAGGGRGAGVGAAVGGAAGAGDVLLTRGKPATLATETRINFRLSAPVTITEGSR